MATDKLFSIVGVSSLNGGHKVRFANDIARIKVLIKNGHQDIRLAELPTPMSKLDPVLSIADMDEFQDQAAQFAIDSYISDNGGKRSTQTTPTQVEEESVPF